MFGPLPFSGMCLCHQTPKASSNFVQCMNLCFLSPVALNKNSLFLFNLPLEHSSEPSHYLSMKLGIHVIYPQWKWKTMTVYGRINLPLRSMKLYIEPELWVLYIILGAVVPCYLSSWNPGAFHPVSIWNMLIISYSFEIPFFPILHVKHLKHNKFWQTYDFCYLSANTTISLRKPPAPLDWSGLYPSSGLKEGPIVTWSISKL